MEIIVSFLLLFVHLINGQSLDPIELLNTCLDSQNHKSQPGPESSLFKSCLPWKDLSCCTKETAINIHHTDMYNFTYDHCEEQTGKKMSKECREHFDEDMCFFECEPHIGPWKVQVKRKFGNERYYQVPLCASDCDSWFNACRLDYTCVSNWPRGMNFTKGRNHCPNNAKCFSFDEVYGNAKNFCEQVWDGSWKYTDDKQSCMRISFNGSVGNPNERVAMVKIRDIIQSAHPSGATTSSLAMSCISFVILTMVH